MDGGAMRVDEFSALLQGFLDETLSREDHVRFVELLRNEQAQDFYLDAVHMDNSLRYWAGVEGALQRRSETGLLVAEYGLARRKPQSERPRSRNRKLLALAAALLCVLCGWVLGYVQRGDSKSTLAAPQYSRLPAQHDGLNIAGQVLRFTPDSEWVEADLAVMKGTGLRPGQCLQLKRGVAEIQFADGGSAIMAGPASLEVQSGRSAFLRQGNVTFVSNASSQQLTISTPSSRCQISASQLGATVDDHGAAEIQVLGGATMVSLLNEAGGVVDQRNLTQGVAAKFDASTELISKIAYNERPYIRRVNESFIAYRNFAGFEGNQTFEGTLGMDFVVKDPIVVTKLGVFDSDANGLKRPLKAAIWARDEARSAYRFDDDFGTKVVAEMDFTPDDPGDLVQSNRMKSLKLSVHLRPGAYTIVASGYGEGEPNGNEGDYFYDQQSDTARLLPAPGLRWRGEDLPVNVIKRLDDGRGAVLFVGCARWDTHVGEFPRVVDGGAVNRFRAGTFEFERLDNISGADFPRSKLSGHNAGDARSQGESLDSDTI